MTLRPHRSALFAVTCLSALALGACGDDSETGTGASGAGGAAEGGGGAAAGGGGVGGSGGSGGAVDPIEQSVRDHDWVELENAPSVGGGAKQDDIFFSTPLHGFLASGPSFTIYETEDGGDTWTESFAHDGTYFRAVLFTSEQHGFAGNLGAGLAAQIDDPTLIYETTDAGTTWSPVTTITGAAAKGLCNFSAVDADNIFGIGRANTPAHLLVSADGGANWEAKDLGAELSMAVDGKFFTPTEGVVVGMSKTGQKCTIVRTEDGGDTFEQVFQSAQASSLCWKVHFPTDSVGYVAILDTAGGHGSFAKTTDGGVTWEELPLPVEGPYTGIGVGFLNENIGWMAPEDTSDPVLRTFDGGMTWEEDPVLKAPINRFRFIDDHTVFAVGGKVWKLDLGTP